MSTAIATPTPIPVPCRYFAQGICRFGEMCRNSHDITATTTPAIIPDAIKDVSAQNATPSSWVDAPVFIPKGYLPATTSAYDDKTWAEVAGGTSSTCNDAIGGTDGFSANKHDDPSATMCPYEYECPYGEYCVYQHGELCDMCGLYCLHPTDKEQRRKHSNECVQQHEKDMELSFAIARSKDKTCGICFDTIMEKNGRAKRFGILPNCSHIFCLDCIRKWRQAKQFEHKITRSCPECRIASDFVCPSAFWVDTKEDKDKLLNSYRGALGSKDCKYFKKGEGKCPFGNKCFYKHATPDGKLVDVGCPQRARKLHRNTDELIDLLDIYLWEFVDHRDFNWLEFLSNTTDSDDSDYSDD